MKTKLNGNGMRTKHVLALMTALAVVTNCTPLRAARNDDARIVSAAKQSYVYRTYLKNDDIKIQADDGAVTLKGEVPDRSHKDMAADTVESLPGAQRVDNKLV